MIGDAQGVQEAIKSLLDLKQREATIIEARTTRQQSDSVMVFTVVTIIFVGVSLRTFACLATDQRQNRLPASFLASFFALNIKEFPHEGETVAYKSSWVIPIIFGVAVAFFLAAVPFALRVDAFKKFSQFWKFLRERKTQPKERKKKRDEMKSTSD
ncbi:hypothetical protein PENCOP_c003G00514 [Penicillium coprophilum]|uniref:Uncharacterized protein n=1 Tax=Penicillium coprophilum TaxID=36646 RepID=A0A1V6UYT4_9EURO|nr:hypothetical protein PENCOP_c003G00514 [Penicillium coprophilum]